MNTNDFDEAESLLKVLANAVRLRVVALLVHDELSVGEINEQVPLSQSALSQHLAILRHAQVVNTRRVGQSVFYSIQDAVRAKQILAILDAAQ